MHLVMTLILIQIDYPSALVVTFNTQMEPHFSLRKREFYHLDIDVYRKYKPGQKKNISIMYIKLQTSEG